MPRCAAIARCGACSVAPAQISTRSMSRPFSATVFNCRVFSAPSRHTRYRDSRILHRALDFAEAIHHLAVDGEQQVARLEQRGGGRTGDQPIDAEHLPVLRIVFFQAPHPFIRQAKFARAGQRLHIEFRLEGIQRAAIGDHADHFGDQVGGDAAIDLFQFALRFEREARPQRQHIALLVASARRRSRPAG